MSLPVRREWEVDTPLPGEVVAPLVPPAVEPSPAVPEPVAPERVEEPVG